MPPRPPAQPIYLFADSQLLFWNHQGKPFLNSITESLDRQFIKAAYVGASNGDNPEYFSIFEAAMQTAGISDYRMIVSSFPTIDQAFLNEADIILLSGGSVEAGWKAFNQTDLANTIKKRFYDGAVLMGVSAGAVQLGILGWSDQPAEADTFFHTLNLVPSIVSVHDEESDWNNLKRAIEFVGHGVQGIGIPFGAGLICHPDQSIEALRRPVYEFFVADDGIVSGILVPDPTLAGDLH